MNKAKRAAVIAGNWKMNKTPAEAKALIEEMKPLVANAACDVVLCVPYVDIPAAIEAAAGSNIKIGAENVHFKASGAYTGEVSADMLKAVGVEYVIIGHSERRQYFGETDQTVNLRTKAALDAGLKVILCVGETLEQRELGYTEALLEYQTKIALTGVSAEQLKNVIIAYEPVWSIGPGKTPADRPYIQKIARFILEQLGNVDVVYGGGLKADNAAMLASIPEIAGGLIALTRFSGEIGFYPGEYLEIIRRYMSEA